jgi:hypothetical protein
MQMEGHQTASFYYSIRKKVNFQQQQQQQQRQQQYEQRQQQHATTTTTTTCSDMDNSFQLPYSIYSSKIIWQLSDRQTFDQSTANGRIMVSRENGQLNTYSKYLSVNH